MKVYEHGIDVLGVNQRSSYARYFVKRSMRKIYLQTEPGNKRVSNTMRVMGKSKGWFFEVEKCIGYVPADIARKLVVSGMENKVKARLQMICIEDKDSIDIRFDVLGPTIDYERYCA
jgi:hypothetical protein